jgi:hypothetical protein
MPNPNANAPMGSQSPQPDTQTLIVLLGSLMPLLQRMQVQMATMPLLSPDQRAWSQGNFGVQNSLIDHQAAVSFVEDVTTDALRNLSAYLETHAEQRSELAPCLAVVTQAERSLAVRDYANAFELIWQAYRLVAAARLANPQLPPVRASGQAGAASQSSTTRAH